MAARRERMDRLTRPFCGSPEGVGRGMSEEAAVSTIPLDTEDGGTVVISQQNVGPDNQVGGGEYKNADHQKSPDEAAAEQDQLEEDAPIEP
jgi:hypothetical protein